jgi:hypothetical protein
VRLKRSFLIVIAAVGLGLGLTAAPASAQPTNVLLGNYNLCTSSLQCMNNQNGVVWPGVIQFWNYGGNGEPNNDYNIWLSGYVECSPNSFPFFTTNSALLTLCTDSYSGDEVLKFAWAPNEFGSGYCIDTPALITSGSVDADTWNCVPADFDAFSTQFFIYNLNTHHLVNAGMTAESYEQGPGDIIWLDSCGSSQSNGSLICLGTSTLDWYIENKP